MAGRPNCQLAAAAAASLPYPFSPPSPVPVARMRRTHVEIRLHRLCAPSQTSASVSIQNRYQRGSIPLFSHPILFSGASSVVPGVPWCPLAVGRVLNFIA